MPNVATTIYLSDEDYNEKFIPRKTEILQKMRDYVREELGIVKKDNRKKENKDTNE